MQSVRRVLRTHHTIVARSGHLMLHVHATIQACLSRVMLVVEVVQNNGTRAMALKRALGHMADTAQGVDGTLRALCDELRRSSAPAAQVLKTCHRGGLME
ncbi:hypothetical protein DYB30_000196 [Aphanomyces astaci]|nr:hypothetical protein DYB30_000196 [Aphanomyces astaci]